MAERAVLATNSINFTIEELLPTEVQRRRCVGVRFLHPVYFCPEVAVCSTQPPQVNEELMASLSAFGFEPFLERALPGAQRAKLSNSKVQGYYQQQQEKIALAQITEPALEVQSNTDDWADCSICMSNKADCLLIPCGHHCCCSGCAEELRKRRQPCPICRADIEQYRDRV